MFKKNVGQMFICFDEKEGKFYHFALNHHTTERGYIFCEEDPIIQSLENNGSVLFYIAKMNIIQKRYLKEFKKYVKACIRKGRIAESKEIIEQIADYIGGNTDFQKNGFSLMMKLLEFGIIIHHGSLPLYVRLLLEDYVRKGFCRLCFATSTLEQGVNMPFDVVVLDRLEGSKALSVKNIIGRAGRSTLDDKFDYGKVVLKKSRVCDFRKIMISNDHLNEKSLLDSENINEDLIDYRDAINNETLSDEYNLTEASINLLVSIPVSEIIESFLFDNFRDGELDINRFDFYSSFEKLKKIYEIHLKRVLNQAESGTLENCIRILIWKIKGRTFKNICWLRYKYVSNFDLREKGIAASVKFTYGYHDLPNKKLQAYGLFDANTLGQNVDYDIIVADTYDYLDKLLDYRLSDIYFAAFHLHFLQTGNPNAEKMAKLFKYGTTNERHIMMLRYGLTFEDIENLGDYITNIDENQIDVSPEVMNLSIEKRKCLERYM